MQIIERYSISHTGSTVAGMRAASLAPQRILQQTSWVVNNPQALQKRIRVGSVLFFS
jgi:hypothetical protein